MKLALVSFVSGEIVTFPISSIRDGSSVHKDLKVCASPVVQKLQMHNNGRYM